MRIELGSAVLATADPRPTPPVVYLRNSAYWGCRWVRSGAGELSTTMSLVIADSADAAMVGVGVSTYRTGSFQESSLCYVIYYLNQVH